MKDHISITIVAFFVCISQISMPTATKIPIQKEVFIEEKKEDEEKPTILNKDTQKKEEDKKPTIPIKENQKKDNVSNQTNIKQENNVQEEKTPTQEIKVETKVEQNSEKSTEKIQSTSQDDYIRSTLITMINKERGAPVFQYAPLLTSSTIRAKEAYQKWSHTRPDGSRWNTTLSSIIDIQHTLHGENLAKSEIPYMTQYSKDELYSLCQTLHQALVNSPTHYTVMTNTNYKKVNIGIYTYQNDNILTIVIAQHYTE